MIDYFLKWARLKRQQTTKERTAMAKKSGLAPNSIYPEDRDGDATVIERLLSSIPQRVMAEASYRCKAYARALMHFELHIRQERKYKSETDLQPLYAHLQKIYTHIDEPDGMEGIATKFRIPTIDQQILEHESCGNWAAAQTCYELSLQRNPDNMDHHVGLLNCLRNLGHIGTNLNFRV